MCNMKEGLIGEELPPQTETATFIGNVLILILLGLNFISE